MKIQASHRIREGNSRLGFQPNARIVGMKIQGVTADYGRQLKDLGFQPNAEEAVGMKIQGETPEYVKEIRGLGFQPNAEQIVGMKIQHAPPERQSAGGRGLQT